jgi:hypothetical protein
MRFKTTRPLVAIAVLSLLLAGCGGGGDETGTSAGGGFSVYVCEPESLIPQDTNETCGAEVLGAAARRPDGLVPDRRAQ